MHRIITTSIIALALIATGCEQQARDKLQSLAKDVRSKIIDSWTTHEALIVEFSTALYKPGCAVCLHSHSEWMCEDVCRDLVIIRSIEDDMRLHVPGTTSEDTFDANSFFGVSPGSPMIYDINGNGYPVNPHEIGNERDDSPLGTEPDLTVSSINGEPISQKKVEDMAVGEEGWTPPGSYNPMDNALYQGSIILSRRTNMAEMHVKRTEFGFEVTKPEPGEKKDADCYDTKDLLNDLDRIIKQMEKERAI